MKKIFTLAMSLALFSVSYAQSSRTVLIEEATNASCGPCAAQNPYFNELLQANTSNVVSIKYQAPYPGYDPMNLHNPADVSNRMAYYPGITGVPTAMIDGKIPSYGSYPGFLNGYDGAPGAFSQAALNHATSITSPFELEFDYTLTENEITVTASAMCTGVITGNLKFHVVVIEKEIIFETAPGNNGEKVFENVMKKMLPTANGETMAASYDVGDEFSTTQTWNLTNVYRIDRLAVVVYIQNDTNKEVLQAGELFKPYHNQDAEVLDISELPTYTCEPVVTPSVKIMNNGNTELTSLNINYLLNDVSGTLNWTGSLGFYESEIVPLNEMTFVPDGDETIEITISDPNNSEDDMDSNNFSEALVNLAPDATLDITVEIHTDYYVGETSWEIRNSDNEIVASHAYTGPANGGGPNANTIKTHEVMLDEFDCHQFKLMDGYGDGMGYGPAGSGPYGYRFIDGNGNVLLEKLEYNFSFGDETVAGLLTENLVKVDEVEAINSLSLYPNPTTSNLNIAFELENNDYITVDVMNIVGQIVTSQDFGNLPAGYTLKSINVSDLSSGIYLVNINTNSGVVTRKITVSK